MSVRSPYKEHDDTHHCTLDVSLYEVSIGMTCELYTCDKSIQSNLNRYYNQNFVRYITKTCLNNTIIKKLRAGYARLLRELSPEYPVR